MQRLIAVCATTAVLVSVVADAQQDETGREETQASLETNENGIFGRVNVFGDVPELPPLLEEGARTKDSICAEKAIPDESLIVGEDGGLKNVFVYLRRVPPGLPVPMPKGDVRVASVECRFSPHAQVMQVGQELTLVNKDPIAENCNVRGLTFQFNMTLPPCHDPNDPQTASFLVKSGERFPSIIVDDFHPWKRAWLLPLDHPFADVTDANGKFEIRGLPVGEYEFVVWHERVGYLNRRLQVEVFDDKPTEIGLSYSVNDFLKPRP